MDDALEGISTQSVIAQYKHHGSPLVRALVARLRTTEEAYMAGYDQALNDALDISVRTQTRALEHRANRFDPEGV